MVDVISEFGLFKADFDEVEKIKQTNNSEFKEVYQKKREELSDNWFTNNRFIKMLKKLIDPNEGLFNLYKKKITTLLILLAISSFFLGPMQTGDTIPLPGQPLGPPNNNFIFKRCDHKLCIRENPQHILESIHPGELNVATVSILGHNIRKMVAQLKKPQLKKPQFKRNNPYKRKQNPNPAGKTRFKRGGKRKRLTRKIKRTRKTRTGKTRSKRAKTQKHRTK
jgi:hypothetical protein